MVSTRSSAIILSLLNVVAAASNAHLAGSYTNTGNLTVFSPLYPAYSNSTPIFHNVSESIANPLTQVLQYEGSFQKLLKDDPSYERTLPVGTCAPGTPCTNGACCSNTGICGYSPDQCGPDVCIADCDAKAECGDYAPAGKEHCPMNACCSYFGSCGTTDDFCNTNTTLPCQQGYGSCGSVTSPSCDFRRSKVRRAIGYYESRSSTRVCDARLPGDIDTTPFTHLNFGSAYFDPSTFQLVPMHQGDEDLYIQFTDLRSSWPDLQTWISIGGWSFTDPTNIPNTQTAFSDMVGSVANRQAFISSLTRFMDTYGFNGVDIDWKYPGALDRGGAETDTSNLVIFVNELRASFGSGRGISVTLPSTYQYLRLFDVHGMQDSVDWFNFMSYDLHGVWDKAVTSLGPYVRPHTNWTTIAEGLDLLWRANIDPLKVNLGIGWYGRSFTLADPSCNTPGCIFSSGGNPGLCTDSSGTLSNAEINAVILQNNLVPTFDTDAAVKWISWDNDQWVSYEDGHSIRLKEQRAEDLCLGGTFVWAIDLDDDDHTSGKDLLGIGPSSGLSEAGSAALTDRILYLKHKKYIERSCYWSACADETCKPGFFAVTSGSGQIRNHDEYSVCPSGKTQILCCVSGTTLGKCRWEGWRGVGLGCVSMCSDPEYEIIATNSIIPVSEASVSDGTSHACLGGYQVYCCMGFRPSLTIGRML